VTNANFKKKLFCRKYLVFSRKEISRLEKNLQVPAKPFTLFRRQYRTVIWTDDHDWIMACSSVPAGPVRPGILLLLIVIMLVTAGCAVSFESSGLSPAVPGPADTAGNETNTSAQSYDLVKGLQGYIAQPAVMHATIQPRQTTIAAAVTNGFSVVGPPLNAKGNDVNMSEIVLRTETITPL
jgi:hypothetical protein